MPLLIRSACLTGYVEVACSLGLDPFGLVREVGIDRSWLVDPDIKIPTDPVIRLLEMSASAARVEDFGLRMAETRQLSNLGPVALAARDAATLREALEARIRYLSLHNEAMLLSLEPIGDVVIFKSDLVAEHCSVGRQAIELVVGVTHRFIRQLSGGTWRSRPVWLSHGPPTDMTSHLRLFGPWVEFGQDCNGILLEASDLDAPLPGSDPAMASHVKQYLEPMLAQIRVTVSEQVQRLVYDLLASRRASVEEVAARLGMNRRALHRQLAREGMTFSSILDHVRVDLARRHIEDGGLPLSEVAHLLGFSELSGFSRWFRALFGCSPMSWRQAERNRAPQYSASPVSPQN
jgi:AraC-like DNA-binding protein